MRKEVRCVRTGLEPRPMSRSLVILGPQRSEPTLPVVLEALHVQGPLVAITAGWRHDEADLDALQGAVGPVTSLPLYRWFDEVPAHAPNIAATYHERQKRIQRFKDLYRLRMHGALNTVRDLVRLLPTAPELVTREIERSAKVVRGIARGIDAEALAAVDEVRAAFSGLDERFQTPWIRERRDEAAALIAGAGAVLVAGGHVAVLRNRMLFFGVEHGLAQCLDSNRPVICWGAGAMVMSERIVLFYDDAPDGPAEAEILDHGLGFAPNAVLFPHVNERLRLDDKTRVAALAYRFGPDACIGLENGAWIEFTDAGWRRKSGPETVVCLCSDGTVIPMEQS